MYIQMRYEMVGHSLIAFDLNDGVCASYSFLLVSERVSNRVVVPSRNNTHWFNVFSYLWISSKHINRNEWTLICE